MVFSRQAQQVVFVGYGLVLVGGKCWKCQIAKAPGTQPSFVQVGRSVGAAGRDKVRASWQGHQ